MTQQQSYDVVKTIDGYELRRYHPCVVADVTVTGDFDRAGSAGFRPLVNYISGANHSASKVAMTAPVIQQPPSSIQMTAPVLATNMGDSHVISFVMPAHFHSVSQLPIPNDKKVSLRAIPEQLALVDKFSGRWTESTYQDRLSAITTHAIKSGLEINGPARFARFDPPWTPWFMRRNEIQLPVAEKP